jgi:hypothetical protein
MRLLTTPLALPHDVGPQLLLGHPPDGLRLTAQSLDAIPVAPYFLAILLDGFPKLIALPLEALVMLEDVQILGVVLGKAVEYNLVGFAVVVALEQLLAHAVELEVQDAGAGRKGRLRGRLRLGLALLGWGGRVPEAGGRRLEGRGGQAALGRLLGQLALPELEEDGAGVAESGKEARLAVLHLNYNPPILV